MIVMISAACFFSSVIMHDIFCYMIYGQRGLPGVTLMHSAFFLYDTSQDSGLLPILYLSFFFIYPVYILKSYHAQCCKYRCMIMWVLSARLTSKASATLVLLWLIRVFFFSVFVKLELWHTSSIQKQLHHLLSVNYSYLTF